MSKEKKPCVCTNAYTDKNNNVLCGMVKLTLGTTECLDVGTICNHIKPRASDVRGGL